MKLPAGNRNDRTSPSHNSTAAWLVDAATSPLKALKPLMPSQGDVLEYWINQDKPSYRLQLTISDLDLQGLVNQFGQLGYTLISPAAPQPGLFKSLDFTGKTVIYEVDFVKK